MAFDAYLEITDIPGESTDSKHKDWIELIGFSHRIDQPTEGTASSGGGRASGKANHGIFWIRKQLDKATPKLMLATCDGTHIPEITVQLCQATGDKQQYMQYKFTDCLISSVQPAGTSDDEALPVEQVGINYGKIEETYTETDHKTGKPKGDIKAHWDTTTNEGG